MKITAEILSAEEITGQEGCIGFSIELNRLHLTYSKIMGNFVGHRIEVTWDADRYYAKGFYWHKSWLKDIREEIDWSEVKKKTKVITDFGVRGYFSYYNVQNKTVWVFANGKTSWSAKNSVLPYHPDNVKLADED